MDNNIKNLRSLKTRKPWGRPLPSSMMPIPAQILEGAEDVTLAQYTQADMLREYYPSSHKINDPIYYPDIYMKEEYEDANGKLKSRYYCQHVPRKAYAFQQIIATKRAMHLASNDIQFEHVDAADDKMSDTFTQYRNGWAQKNMDIKIGGAIYETMVVADAAIVHYMDEKGKYNTRTLSFMKGDTLYPHFKRDGKTLTAFVRSFSRYDEEGDQVAEYMEVWTDKAYYVFRKKGEKYKSIVEKYIYSPILKMFNLDDYDCIENSEHGFQRVPVAYHRRNDGPAWIFSQDTIDAYELAKSQMAQNNEEYGEPALVITSEEEAITTTRNAKGTIREYHVGPNDKVEMLQAASAADSYTKETEADEKLIYKQSFCVDAPEPKSGDLPAQTVKILYSLAIEKASIEALEYQDFVQQNVELFAIGYGTEVQKSLDFIGLLDHMRYWIEPYVHESTSAKMADLAIGVQNKFISRKTASEQANIYSVPDEWARIQQEIHEEQQQDIISQIRQIKAKAQQNNPANK